MSSIDPTAAIGDGADGQDRQLAAFMVSLERELAAGEVTLPSWSKVTERARNALAAPTINVEELARLLGAEAGLAVRVLTLANSAIFMRGSRPLSDLKLAILRIGHDMLRSAVYAHALLQLRQAPRLQRLRPILQELWRESTQVAALARLGAARTADSDPDAALLAGLLHNIGKLYLYVRLDNNEDQSLAAPISVTLLTAWHARIGAAIARNWQMPEVLCQAVADQDLLDDSSTHSDLGAALSVAVIGANASADPLQLEETAAHLANFSRFGFNATEWLELLVRAQAESTALRVTFGD
jgi:HD-like signal output (HDOD) protein